MDFGSFFRDIGRNVSNFLGLNNQEEERKRQLAEAQAQSTAPRPSSTQNVTVSQQPLETPKLRLPTVTPQQKLVNNPFSGPYSPEVQNQALKAGFAQEQAQKPESAFDVANKIAGKIPIISEGAQIGAGLAAALGSTTGNYDLVNRANRARTLQTLEMTPEQLSAQPKEVRDRLGVINDIMTIGSPVLAGLDLVSGGQAGTAISAARNAGVQGAKDIAIGTARNAAIGGLTSAGIGTGINNYVQTGNAGDFSNFNASDIPQLFTTGALYSMIIPTSSTREALSNSSKNVRRSVNKFSNEADVLATRAAQSDSELGSMGNGIVSKNRANSERASLQTAASQSRQAANILSDAELRLSRAVDAATPERPVTPTYEPPRLQATDSATARLQQAETPRVEPITQPVIEQTPQAVPPVETPQITQVADNVVPEAPVSQVTTPDGTPVTAQRLESISKAEARQAAEQAAPMAPENAPAQLSDAEARVRAQRAAEANVDDITLEKTAALSEQSDATPRPEGTVRLYQGTENGVPSGNYFDNIGQLENYYKFRSENVNLDFVDVPASQAQKVAGKKGEAGVYEIAQPAESRATAKITASDEATNKVLSEANSALSTEGGSYGKLATKLYNNQQKIGEFTPLTDAERAVADKIQPELNKVLDKMNELGLTDADMGLISDYLPTAKLDETGTINTAADVAARDFGFSKRRTGALTPEQVEAGAEEALRNYMRVGALLDELTPEQVSQIKFDRRTSEFRDMFEYDSNGGSTGITPSDEAIAKNNRLVEELNNAEVEKAKIDERVNNGDTSDSALDAQNKAQQDLVEAQVNKKVEDYIALEEATNKKIKNIKSSDAPRETKRRQITQLESHLKDVRNETYYAQSTVRTNLLFGVGRIADQINKGAYATGDALTGAISKLGANRAYKKATGADLFADSETLKSVWGDLKSDPRLNSTKINAEITRRILERQDAGKSALRVIPRSWRATGTRLTEAGSRYRIANKDTVSFFSAQAQGKGITDPAKITKYVDEKIGSAEWNRVQSQMFEARNMFTGLPTRGGGGNKDFKLDIKNGIYNELGRSTNLSSSARENIADALSIPVVGFPRLVFRLGAKGFDLATFGAPNFIKAARINPTTEAQALKKALLFQQAIRDAQGAPALGALGVYLGASGLTTGAYPENANERARWQRDRIQPYSIKVGDQYVDIGRYLGPAAFPIMIGASIGKGNPEDIPGTVTNVTQQFIAQYGGDSVGDILTMAGSMLNGDWNTALSTDIQRTAAGIVDAFIPAASVIGTVGKAEDMVVQRAKPDTSGGFVDALQARLPLVRANVPGTKDTLGNAITQGNAFNLLPGVSGGQKSALTPAESKGQVSVESEIDRLAGAGFETMPSKQATNAEGSTKWGELVIGSDLYKKANDETKAEYLKKSLAGTDAKNINDSLSDEQKLALLTKELVGEKTHKKNLDGASYARDYYTAAYENAVANDTLTADDDNLQSTGSLHYKAISSQVNASFKGWTAELENLYNDTTEAELNDMALDDPNRQLLLDLDKARAEAGVSRDSSDKSTAKYEKTLSGTYGTKGKKTSLKLPTLAVKSPSGGSGTLASLEARPTVPTVPAIAKTRPKARRSISVKRGVQL